LGAAGFLVSIFEVVEPGEELAGGLSGGGGEGREGKEEGKKDDNVIR
jgi:hypothetical protein